MLCGYYQINSVSGFYFPWRLTVDAVALSNIALPITFPITIAGVSISATQRYLLTTQSPALQNGIYTNNIRTSDFDISENLFGLMIYDNNLKNIWYTTNGVNDIIGTNAATFSMYGISNLGGVVLSSPTNGQILTYNGTNWVNTTGSPSGGVTSWNGSTGVVTAGLGNLNNVSLSSPGNGQTLGYNGTNWVNSYGQYYQTVLESSTGTINMVSNTIYNCTNGTQTYTFVMPAYTAINQGDKFKILGVGTITVNFNNGTLLDSLNPSSLTISSYIPGTGSVEFIATNLLSTSWNFAPIYNGTFTNGNGYIYGTNTSPQIIQMNSSTSLVTANYFKSTGISSTFSACCFLAPRQIYIFAITAAQSVNSSTGNWAYQIFTAASPYSSPGALAGATTLNITNATTGRVTFAPVAVSQYTGFTIKMTSSNSPPTTTGFATIEYY